MLNRFPFYMNFFGARIDLRIRERLEQSDTLCQARGFPLGPL